MITQDQLNPEYLIEFMYHAAIGVAQTDLAGHTLMLNPVAIQLLMPLARPGDHLDNLFVTLDPLFPDLARLVGHAGARTGMLVDRHRIPLPASTRERGTPLCLSLSVVRVASDCLTITIEDVSATVTHEHLLGKQEAWINALYGGAARHGQVLLDKAGRIVSWDPHMERLTGFLSEDLIGRPYAALFAEDAMTDDRMNDRLMEVDRVGFSFAQNRMQRADRSVYWGHTMITCIPPALNRDGYELLVRDIDEHRETLESLLRAASSDPLTGLANRRALLEAADIEFDRHKRKPRDIGLLLIDIDHFKQINDTYGHPVGDKVIRNLAAVLLQSVRSIDVVARIGGEEFAVLLPSTDQTMAVLIAERIRSNAAAQRIVVSAAEINYRVSIGVARVTSEIQGLDDLIEAADHALYDAKHQGRDRISTRT